MPSPTYFEKSRDLLEQAHDAANKALSQRVSQRNDLLAKLVSVDQQIVHLTNQRADFLTGICRLDGVANTFMPSTSVTVARDDTYVPNPFAGELVNGPALTEKEGFLLEAADQIGGMKYLDSDITICAFTTEGLLKFLRTVIGPKRFAKLQGKD